MTVPDSIDDVGLGGVTVQRIIRLLWAQKWLVLAVMLLSAALAYAATLFMPRVYRAETLLAVVDARGGGSTLATLTSQLGLGLGDGGVLPALGGSPEEYLAMLTSRRILNDLIVKHQLKTELFRDKLDATSGRWLKHEPSLADAYKTLIQDVIRVEQNRTTRLVTVAFEWTDPDLAAHWTRLLVDTVNVTAREGAAAEAEKTLATLRGLLGTENIVSVRETISRVIEAQLNTLVAAKSRDQFAFRIIDPALVPDEDKYVRPREAVITLLGMILGLLVAASSLVLRDISK